MASRILTILALCLASSLAQDINVSDYIYWKKADIVAWHQYFPSRVLEEERLTNQLAVIAVTNIFSSLNNGLAKVVEFQKEELDTAQQLMAGTDAEGCVTGISDYMTKAISDEIATYDDCAADALSKFKRLNATWTKLQANYLTAYQKALSGIDVCAKIYPNKDSIARLTSCVESMNSNYFTVANATQKAFYPSPSMSYFQDVIVGCASSAATAVADKGSQFLKKLLECSALDSNIDQTSYAEQLNQWKGYTDTLASQVSTCQSKHYVQVRTVEAQMISYYNLQKESLEKYVIASRGLDFYKNRMYSYLSSYYNTITSTLLENPANSGCTDDATKTLDFLVSTSANKSLSCDLDIVGKTKQMIGQVSGDFVFMNALLPAFGNVAILNCFAQGYVFAPETISKCFDLTYWQFDVEYTDRSADIDKNVAVMTDYETSFFSGSDLPCGRTSLKRAFLAAEFSLYNLQRCLYTTTGTVYAVTTPPPSTTTPQQTATA